MIHLHIDDLGHLGAVDSKRTKNLFSDKSPSDHETIQTIHAQMLHLVFYFFFPFQIVNFYLSKLKKPFKIVNVILLSVDTKFRMEQKEPKSFAIKIKQHQKINWLWCYCRTLALFLSSLNVCIDVRQSKCISSQKRQWKTSTIASNQIILNGLWHT